MIRRLLVLALIPCAALAAPKVTSTKLFADKGGKAGAEVEYFNPQQHKLHFLARLDKLKLGKMKFRWVFTGVDTSAGKNVKIKDLEITSMVANESTAELSLPRDWPFGTYTADVYVGADKVKTIPFVVSPPPAQLKALGSTLFRDNGKHQAGKEVKGFSPKDHMLFFEVALNGFPMGKCNSHWRFIAVKTTAGNNRDITSVDKDVSNLKGNRLVGHVSLPRDWPTGTYRAEVSLNNRVVTSIPFAVK